MLLEPLRIIGVSLLIRKKIDYLIIIEGKYSIPEFGIFSN